MVSGFFFVTDLQRILLFYIYHVTLHPMWALLIFNCARISHSATNINSLKKKLKCYKQNSITCNFNSYSVFLSTKIIALLMTDACQPPSTQYTDYRKYFLEKGDLTNAFIYRKGQMKVQPCDERPPLNNGTLNTCCYFWESPMSVTCLNQIKAHGYLPTAHHRQLSP